MITCYRCAKQIKGAVVAYQPSILALQLRVDFAKSFHPACYAAAEKEAARALSAPVSAL